MPSSLRASSFAKQGARARSSISLGAAFALFCVVLVGYEPSASQAGFFDDLFGPSAPHPLSYNGLYDRAAPPSSHKASRRHAARQERRHATTHQARRQISERHKLAGLDRRRRESALPAEPESARDFVGLASPASVRVTRQVSENATQKTFCVRSCDGYHFQAMPIAKDSDIPVQQADCAKLCPGAESVLFVAPSGSGRIEDAKSSRTGETYAQLVARINPADSETRACSCQTEAAAAASTNAAMSDPTLRPGDTVVTPQGIRVVRRGSHYPFRATDFLSLAETRDAPVSHRSALYAIERALKMPQGRLAVANSERRRHGRHDRI